MTTPAKNNPLRPLGEVVTWNVPCKFEVCSFSPEIVNVVYDWTGCACRVNGQVIEFDQSYASKPLFRLHVPETVESVLSPFNIPYGSLIDVNLAREKSIVAICINKMPSLENAKILREKFIDLRNFIESL